MEAACNGRDVAILDEVCAADFVYNDPASPGVRSLEEYKQFTSAMLEAFPDLHFTQEDLVVENEKVTIRWTARGTHQGPLTPLGLPPTGKQATVAGIGISRVEGGQIAEMWQNWDALGMLQQLGAIPSLGQ
jgi:steroid delta-isomerase-like uncharacterized protein